MSLTLPEQQALIRRAIDKLDAGLPPSEAVGRGTRLTLGYTLADHDDEGCPISEGECHGVTLARSVLGE